MVAVVLCALPSTSWAQLVQQDAPRTTLSPGDALRITVWRQAEMSGEFVIAQDGSIIHPLYRELKVAGIPLPAVEDRIREFLTRFESHPEFVVLPLLRIVVAGEVRQPNVYTVPVGTSVAAAIASAGGPSERGRLDQVRVQRGTTAITLDLTRPDPSTIGFAIRSGDEVIVGRRRSFVQDVLTPMSSIIAAGAALTTVFIQLRK